VLSSMILPYVIPCNVAPDVVITSAYPGASSGRTSLEGGRRRVTLEEVAEELSLQRAAEERRLERAAEKLHWEKVAEELRLAKVAEELQVQRAAEELRLRKIDEELRLQRAAEELRLRRADEEARLERAAEELRLERIAEELHWKKVAEELRLKKIAEEQAEQAAKATQEAAATVEEMVLPSTKATFGAGVTVNTVLTGHETCRILVKNLPLNTTKANVATLFPQPRFDPAKFTVYQPRAPPSDRSHLEAAVEFENLEDGKNAVAELNEIEFGPEKEKLKLVMTPRQGGMGKSKDRDPRILTITWAAPPDTVFASYSSMEEAQLKRTELEKTALHGKKNQSQFRQEAHKVTRCVLEQRDHLRQRIRARHFDGIHPRVLWHDKHKDGLEHAQLQP
jgi:hypothetical protein